VVSYGYFNQITVNEELVDSAEKMPHGSQNNGPR